MINFIKYNFYKYRGEFLILINTTLWGALPVCLRDSENFLPPIFFAGMSLFFAGLCFFIITILKKDRKKIFQPKILRSQIYAVILITIFNFLLFCGGQKISADSSGIFLQTQIFFAILIFGFLKIEKFSRQKIIAAILIFLGIIMIFLHNFVLNTEGNFLILGAATIAPIATFFQQKISKIADANIAGVNYLLIGICLLVLSFLIGENVNFEIFTISKFWKLILASSAIYFFASFLWFSGLRYVEISLALMIDAFSPIFTLFFAFLFLQEIPSLEQLIGLIFIMNGVIFAARNYHD